MNDDLLFVTRIAAAFEQADVQSALRGAFEEIERVGVANRWGHTRFRQFMALVRRASDDLSQMEGEVRAIMLSLLSADRKLDRRAMRMALLLIGSRSSWRSEYVQLRETMRAIDRHPAAEFVVTSDDRPIGSISLV